MVKLSVESPEGREAILGFQHPGDLFGALAVIDDGPHDHLAEAYEDSTIWTISRTSFQGLMQDSPALAQEIITLLGLRVRVYRTAFARLFTRAPVRAWPTPCSISLVGTA